MGELGKAVKATCTLPGCKRQRGEGPKAAMQRLMSKEMQPFANLIEFLWSVEENLDAQESARFGVRTRYLRTVQLANLILSAEQPEIPVAPYRTDPGAGSPSASLARKQSGDFSYFDWRDLLNQDVLMINNGDVIRL